MVSVVHPGSSSDECRLRVLSSARVAEFEWKNSSEIPIGSLCIAILTRERCQLSNFTEVIEEFEDRSVDDTIKTIVHNKGVIEVYRPDSEECQELQRSYNRIVVLEKHLFLSRSELQARLQKNLSRVEDAWPEDEDGGGIVPVRESDTEHKSDAHVNKIFLATPNLRVS